MCRRISKPASRTSAGVWAASYHRHVGPWPDVRQTPWLQWTASPPSVADLDRDGRNEVIGVPNVEMEEPYETQAYAFMVLDGAEGSGKRSARRHKGFRRLPLTSKPAVRPDGDWYPPSGIPAPTVVNIRGNRRPEIIGRFPTGMSNGNGIGIPAAPSIGDVNGDRRLEIVVSPFDHGIDIYRVPRSNTRRLPWPTGRVKLLRNGADPPSAPSGRMKALSGLNYLLPIRGGRRSVVGSAGVWDSPRAVMTKGFVPDAVRHLSASGDLRCSLRSEES